ncbi:MAG: non-heme iron oxygenase ferredoxin subunit [Gammaproteobacteria bacterium]|nr:non-heme iron oxygenase ferredoxin subunit [Gammaproteobacteria bacterium]
MTCRWLSVCAKTDIPVGEWITFDTGTEELLIVNLEGDIYAIQDLCTHDGGNLADGELDGEEIVCPRHGARFCVKNGKVTTPPAYEDIKAFPTRIEKGMIEVQIDED